MNNTTKTAFLMELEKHHGILQHDYANDLHYRYLLDLYGGKERLQSQFPLVYEVLEQTRNKSLQKNLPPVIPQDAVQDDMKEEFLIDSIDFGRPPKSLLSESQAKAATDSTFLISACMRANLLKKADLLTVRGYIYDTKDPERPVAVVNEYIEHSYQLESYIHELLSQEALPNNLTYRGEATFTYFISQGNETTSTSVTVRSDFLILADGSSSIKSTTVQDPKYKTPPVPPSTRPIVVVYDREWYFPQEQWDYSYNGLVHGPGTGQWADVHLDFRGSTTADDNHTFLPFDKNKKFLLQLIFDTGAAEYQNTRNFATYFTLSNDKKTMSWNFDPDWKSQLDLSRFAAKTVNLKFYCNMTLPVQYIGTTYMHDASIIIESSDQPSLSPSHLHIPFIIIKWGCLAKGTKITMANGQEKNVEDLRIGESVLSSEGKPLVLRNIVSGTEKTMIYIETFSGHNVKVTQTHPVFTTRGIIDAGDVTPADSIYAIGGAAEKVRYCCPMDYNDTVYSLYFDGQNGIICNRLILGDFNMQNSDRRPAEAPQVSAGPASPLITECIQLFQTLKEEGAVHE